MSDPSFSGAERSEGTDVPAADAEVWEVGNFQILLEDGRPVELGRGAMGVTYKARDKELGRTVVLKVISPKQELSSAVLERFKREAKIASRLKSPHVATIYGFGYFHGQPYFAMEFIEGETLEQRIKREKALDVRTALEVTRQIALALIEAKDVGIIHRDIKPSNVMLVETRYEPGFLVKLIDFGLARPESPNSQDCMLTLTQGGIVGTPYYASPEQLQESPVDIRSDLYSLGVTLFHMLTGEVPFQGTFAQVITKQIEYDPPLEKLQGCPICVVELLRRLLKKNPNERFAEPKELVEKIENCLKKLPQGEKVFVAKGSSLQPMFAQLYQLLGTKEDLENYSHQVAREVQTGSEVEIFYLSSKIHIELLDFLKDFLEFSHPNFRQVRAVFSEPPAIVLERCDGVRLVELIRREQRFPLDVAAGIFAPVAEVIDALGDYRQGKIKLEKIPLDQVWIIPRVESAKELYGFAMQVKVDPVCIRDWVQRDMNTTMVGTEAAMYSFSSTERTKEHRIKVLAKFVYEVFSGGRNAPRRETDWKPLSELSGEANHLLLRGLYRREFSSCKEFCENLLRYLPQWEGGKGARGGGGGSGTIEKEVGYRAPIAPAPISVSLLQSSSEEVSGKGVKRKWMPLAVVGGAVAMVGVLALVIGLLVSFSGRKSKLSTSEVRERQLVTQLQQPADATLRATPAPTGAASPSPAVDLYSQRLEQAKSLEGQPDPVAALLVYSQLAVENPNDSRVVSGLERVSARIESENKPDGVFSGFGRARDALETAARLGSTSAMFLLGTNLSKTEPRTAFRYFQQAADKGNTEAMFRVADMLARGALGERDYNGAFQWYERAANQGHVAATTMLADCYLRGLGVERNPERAVQLLEVASNFGDTNAMDLLGDLIRRGVGVPQRDPARAFQLFKRAAELGDLDAQGNLGVMYMIGDGTPANPQKAVELWQDGAKKGNPTCMFLLAQSLEDPNVGNRPEEAKEWYLKAARGGNAAAIKVCKERGWKFTIE